MSRRVQQAEVERRGRPLGRQSAVAGCARPPEAPGVRAGHTPAQAGHSVTQSVAMSKPGSTPDTRAGVGVGGSIGKSRCRRSSR